MQLKDVFTLPYPTNPLFLQIRIFLEANESDIMKPKITLFNH